MYLENLVLDALDPQRLGRFWEAALAAETLTDEPDIFETRVHHPGGPYLDLCFQRVPDPPSEPPRVHLGLAGGTDPQGAADRLLELGARTVDGATSDGGSALVDVEDNPLLVATPEGHDDTGPLAVIALDSSDPEHDAELWRWLSGWVPVPGAAPVTLRHPSRRGPLLELHAEAAPKGPRKNRRHLDVRLEAGDDPDRVARLVAERGGRELDPGWGALPWRIYADPSGNEFCVLPAPAPRPGAGPGTH